MKSYNDVVNNGCDNYISLLKSSGLYEEVIARLSRKNTSEPNSLIYWTFKNEPNFSEYLFSDLTYSIDEFYESFESRINYLIAFSFKGLEFDFQITTNFDDMESNIIIYQGIQNFEFNWLGFDEENLTGFLNFLNTICARNNCNNKWFPIASSYGSSFMFTKLQNYQSIINLNLMPPDGFFIDEFAKVYYPKGIEHT